MTIKSPFFVSNKYKNLLKQIKLFEKSPEPGVVISAPLNGMPFRINQIIQNHINSFNFAPIHIEFGVGMEDVSNIENRLKTIGYSLYEDKLCLLISNADFWFKERSSTLLTDLVNIQRSSNNLKIVFFFEKNLLNEDNAACIQPKSLLGQIYYFPMFDTNESEKYLHYLSDIWNIAYPPKDIAKKIVRQCGNHMWLLTQSLREWRLQGHKMDIDSLINIPRIKFRLELIAKSFSKEEGEALINKDSKYPDANTFLESIGILKNRKCTVPLLYDFFIDSTLQSLPSLKSGDIYLKGVNLRYSFTDQENLVLKKLIQNRNTVVTRDQLAEVIWRHEATEKYSVWAIEQLMMRLRNKLNVIGISKRCIVTRRSLGYMFASNI